MKKKIFIVLAVIAGIALIGYVVLKIMTKNAERHVESETGLVVSSAKLMNDYTSSSANADSLYLNKTLEVTGEVLSADTNENHQSVVLLRGNAGGGISCTFAKKLAGVGPGKLITCKGICTGMLSNVTLNNCILTAIKNIVAPLIPDSTTQKADTPVIAKTKDTLAAPAVKVYNTSKAVITFSGGGSVEDIKATNNQVEAMISSAGAVQFKLAVLGFTFSDALMQEHFNETMESKKFPTAIFKGAITNIKDIDLEKDGTYHATVTGNLTIHGVTQKVNTTAELHVQNGKLKAESSLSVQLAGYKISTEATSSATLSISAHF